MNGAADNNDLNSKAYKPLPTTDMEDSSLSKSKSKEADGADEKMLSEQKYVNNKSPISEKQNGDTKLEIGELTSGFVGMGKEDLMKYVNDPFWIKVRWALFIGFWLIWAAMLLGAIYLIYAAPKCIPPPPKTWWEKSPLTKIQLETTPENLILDEHIEGVIVSWPDDTYATFDMSHKTIKLVNSLKSKGKNVIMEVDPTQSNVWFEQSEMKDSLYGDYYIWKAGTNANGLPNNWLSPSNRSSWKLSTKRNENYYIPFEKPHLNFYNREVVNEFSKVLQNFLAHNVSGIRLKNAAFLLVDRRMDDQLPRPNIKGSDITQYGFYDTSKTEYRPELAVLVKTWRDLIRNKTENGPLMVTEELQKPAAFKVDDNLVVDLPLQEHVFSKSSFSVPEVANHLNVTFTADGMHWPLWKASTKALSKDVLDMITYLLPGTPFVEPNDTLNKDLLKIRESPSIMRGTTDLYRLNNDTVFAFVRIHSESPGVLVVVNPGNETVTVNIAAEIPLLNEVSVVTIKIWSRDYKEKEFMDEQAKKSTAAVPISAKSGIIFEYVPKKKDAEISH